MRRASSLPCIALCCGSLPDVLDRLHGPKKDRGGARRPLAHRARWLAREGMAGAVIVLRGLVGVWLVEVELV